MGRKPVDKVIEHRIVFGSKERMQLDSLITSLNIKNIATPTVSILNDVTGMIALIGILELIFGVDIIINPTTDKMGDVIQDLKNWNAQRKLEGEQVALGGLRTGSGILDSIIDAIELLGDTQREILTGDTEGMQ
jgi:hypothetical protein